MASHWEETKRSIRDARYRLSLSNNSDVLHQDSKHHKFHNEVHFTRYFCYLEYMYLTAIGSSKKLHTSLWSVLESEERNVV